MTELADASHAIQAKVNDEDVRILEPERLDTGKFRVLYSPDFDEEVEDACELYRRVFLPRMQATRANGEVPGLSTPK